MGRRTEALRQGWCVWTVLFFSTGIKSLVNQVEGPFARSLVVCDEPVQPDAYTGSRWCGDRLNVIQGGVSIQGVGQSQENFAMLCSLTFVVVGTGIWGAKVVLAWGLGGVTISVLLFVLACSSPELGRSLYTIAQGLQGVYPIEYLQGIIMLHLCNMPGTDGQATFELSSYMGIVSNLVWNVGLGNLVSLLELSDYRLIWSCILLLNVAILALALWRFPDMLPFDASKSADAGPFAKVFREVLSYRDLLLDWRPRRLLLKLVFENIEPAYFAVSLPAQLMAYHSWSQSSLTWLFFFPQLLSLACLPFFQAILNHFGHHATYVWCIRYFLASVLLRALTVPATDKMAIFFSYANELLSGFWAFRGFIDSRFAEPEQMQRFQSLQWIMGYFEGIWVGPLYASLFDAYAVGYYGRAWPGLLCCAALAVHYLMIFHAIYDMDGVHGFGVSCRVLDETSMKAQQLWHFVASHDGWIGYEKWELFNFEALLGVPWLQVGGEGIHSQEHWMGLIRALNGTPEQGLELMKKLDKAIVFAQGVHESFTKAAFEQAAKATALWHMVAAEDGWIGFEKWELYQLEAILGLQWAETGEQGVSSQEQWLGLFDPLKASEEALARLDYAIAYAHGVHKAVAQAAIEQAASALHRANAEIQDAGAAEEPETALHAGARLESGESQEAGMEVATAEAAATTELAVGPGPRGLAGACDAGAPATVAELIAGAEAAHAAGAGSRDEAASGAAAVDEAWPTSGVEAVGLRDTVVLTAAAAEAEAVALANAAAACEAGEVADETAVAEAIATAEAIASGAAEPIAEGKKTA